MSFRFRTSALLRSAVLPAFCLTAIGLMCVNSAAAARRAKRKPVITRPRFDPTAKRVKLFDGMKSGVLKVKVIAKNEKRGNVLIENTTDKPLTVELPKAVVGVHVLKQFQGAGGAGMTGAGGLNGLSGQNGQNGSSQISPLAADSAVAADSVVAVADTAVVVTAAAAVVFSPFRRRKSSASPINQSAWITVNPNRGPGVLTG